MVNTRHDTPILMKSYNSRGLIASSHDSKNNVVMLPNGELYAAVAYSRIHAKIMKSTDKGFSWAEAKSSAYGTSSQGFRAVAALNADGPILALMLNEQTDTLDLYYADFDGVDTYSVERARYTISNLEDDTVTDTTVVADANEGGFSIAYNDNECFVTYVDASANLAVVLASPRTTSVSSATTLNPTNNIFGSIISTICDNDGNLDIVYIENDTNDLLKHVRFTEGGGFGSTHTIDTAGNGNILQNHLSLARDGEGTLCVVWDDWDTSANTLTIKYATSTDNGVNWDVNSLTRTLGHSVYNDAIVSDEISRPNIVGGAQGGFAFTYVEDNSSAVPKTYVRVLTTTDGSTYTLGQEQEIAKNNVPSGVAVVGAKFFRPNGTKLMDISSPDLLRVAYQVGEGDSTTTNDEGGVDFYQELLRDSAYPTNLISDLGTYFLDVVDDKSLLVNVFIAAGPSENIDFYSLGFTGNFTQRYIDAFNKIGTYVRILRYDPDQDNEMNDRSAYGAPTEIEELALFDPVTYSFPSPALTADVTSGYTEQDIRKIHLPPFFHPFRDFVINIGGYLKRTVWLIEYDGNYYELSQVIPRFITNQICFYECNGYVVGPSRDPFSRTILPSET